MTTRGLSVVLVFGLVVPSPSRLSAEDSEAIELTRVATFGEMRFRHPVTIVHHVVLDDDRVLTSAEDRRMRLWNAEGKLLRAYPKMDEAGTLVCLPDGERVLWVATDSISLRKISSGKVLRTLARNGAVAFRPDTSEFADGRGIWNWETGEQVRDFRDFLPPEGGIPAPLAFSADSRLLYVSMGRRVKVWNLDTGVEAHVGAYHDWALGQAVLAPDRQSFVASRYGEILLCRTDEMASVVWRRKLGLGIEVTDFAWSADGSSLAVLYDDHRIDLLDPDEGKSIRQMNVEHAPEGTEARGAITFSGDGRYLTTAAGGRLLHRCEIETGERVFPQSEQVHLGLESITSLSVRGDRLFVVGQQADHHKVWESRHSFVEKWDLATRERIERWRAPGPPEFWIGEMSPSGRRFLLGTADGRMIALDAESQSVIWTRPQNDRGEVVTGLRFLDENRVIAASGAGVSVFNLRHYRNPVELPVGPSGSLEAPPLLSPDGRRLAVFQPGGVRILRTRDWTLQRELTIGGMMSLREVLFMPNSSGLVAFVGDRLLAAPVAAGGGEGEEDEDGSERAESWPGDFRVLGELDLEDHFDLDPGGESLSVRGVRPSPDGTSWAAIVLGHREDRVVLGGFDDGGQRPVLRASVSATDLPQSLAWHPDGRSLFVANRKWTVEWWRVEERVAAE